MCVRIVLVGFPGSGKSSFGKKLARYKNWEFKDIDEQFERKYKISISLFFDKYGEQCFRQCERELLLQLLAENNVVIACGGGTPCYSDNMSQILANSCCVYIKMSSASLMIRLTQSKKIRPLIANKSTDELQLYIHDMLPRREFYYLQAHYIVKGENISVESFINEIQNQ